MTHEKHTHVNFDVLVVLRDALRFAGAHRILTDNEYDALLHANAKIEQGPETCSSWPSTD